MDNPLFKNLPKIGLRPTIDGRLGGVRESLESQTLGLARRVGGLIRDNLRYPNGKPVECVIADSCIGGVAEAAACAEKFARLGVGVSLTVTPCWCYGSETMDMDATAPKAVWGFNGTERPGAVYLAAVLAGHAQKGAAGLRDLRARRAGRGRPEHPGGRAGEDFALLPRRPGGGDHARQVLPGHGRHFDGDCRLDGGSRLFRELSGHEGGVGGHDRIHPPHRTGNLRPGGIQKGHGLGQGQLPGGQGSQFARNPPQPRRSWTANGKSRSRWR